MDVVNGNQHTGRHFMTLDQVSNIRLTVSRACLTLALLVDWVQVVLFDWSSFDVVFSVVLLHQQYVLLGQGEWVVYFEMSVAEFSCVFDVLDLAHTGKGENVLLALLFESLGDVVVNGLSFFQSLLFTNITYH